MLSKVGKFLFQPISPFLITQLFGENKACVDRATGSKVIACDGGNPPSGYVSLYGPTGHKGLDLMAGHGKPVYAAVAGIVDSIDTSERSGLDVRIVSEVAGVRFKTIYEHLMGYQPKVGQIVKLGGLIGWADNTGYSSGDHLHFQLEYWNGHKWIPIDPLKYMHGSYVLNAISVLDRVSEFLAGLADWIADGLR